MGGKNLYGIWGKFLRINLTTGDIRVEKLNEDLFKQFMGGRGVGARLLYQELQPNIDPFSEKNVLIFMTGPLEGTLVPLANKATVTFKSPLSLTYSQSSCGGHLAGEIKFAGYDGILIQGRSSKPCMIWIEGDEAKIINAEHLWGKSTFETFTTIKEEANDPFIEIATIGPAGENKVRFANIIADYHRDFGRGGAGAIMGSKLLKAIVIRGNKGVDVADPNGLKKKTLEIYRKFRNTNRVQMRRQFGTADMVDSINELGFLSVHNFQNGQFDDAKSLDCYTIEKDVLVAHSSCLGCSIRCGKVTRIRKGNSGLKLEGPEFESLALLGFNCGIDDLEAVMEATWACDSFGMDTISTGNVIGFAMECYEKGVLKSEDAGGLDLRFGKREGYLEAVQMIGNRRLIGDLLAEGVRIAAEKLGVPELAIHVKGLETPAYDPRGCVGMGLTYATAARGGCHTKSATMGAEIAGDRFSIQGKAELVRNIQVLMAILDSLTICMTSRFGIELNDYLDLWKHVTGYHLDEEEAQRIGVRILNMERLFNCREGLGRKDDTLPYRFLKETIQKGPSKNHRVNLEPMLEKYYSLMGWNYNGLPTPETLRALGIESFSEESSH